MHVVVVANGDLPVGSQGQLAPVLASADAVIAADGGLAHCVALEVWPAVLIGDLDSAPPTLVAEAREHGVRVAQFPADKDATDLELALTEAVELGATEITVLAAFGGRLDHEVATLGLLASNTWREVGVAATDGRRSLWVLRSSIKLALPVGGSVSLIPWFGDVTGVSTEGLAWPLRSEPLPLGSTRGVSNVVASETQSVAISSGVLLVISDSGATATS